MFFISYEMGKAKLSDNFFQQTFFNVFKLKFLSIFYNTFSVFSKIVVGDLF
jgi:hypothetical protein